MAWFGTEVVESERFRPKYPYFTTWERWENGGFLGDNPSGCTGVPDIQLLPLPPVGNLASYFRAEGFVPEFEGNARGFTPDLYKS